VGTGRAGRVGGILSTYPSESGLRGFSVRLEREKESRVLAMVHGAGERLERERKKREMKKKEKGGLENKRRVGLTRPVLFSDALPGSKSGLGCFLI
jgi:hypothetical protein